MSLLQGVRYAKNKKDEQKQQDKYIQSIQCRQEKDSRDADEKLLDIRPSIYRNVMPFFPPSKADNVGEVGGVGNGWGVQIKCRHSNFPTLLDDF